jgi:hypothetical protein
MSPKRRMFFRAILAIFNLMLFSVGCLILTTTASLKYKTASHHLTQENMSHLLKLRDGVDDLQIHVQIVALFFSGLIVNFVGILGLYGSLTSNRAIVIIYISMLGSIFMSHFTFFISNTINVHETNLSALCYAL